MREELRDLSELSDSRELLEAKPNPVMPIFIYILLAILIAAISWAYFGEIDEVVKANGVVQTEDTISTVRVQLSSNVADIHFTEGQQVKAGDVLFTLDQSDGDLQKEMIQSKIEQAERKQKDLETLQKSIKAGEDLFTAKEKEDSEGYKRYQSYQSQLALMEQEYKGSKAEVAQSEKIQEKEAQSLETQKAIKEQKVSQLKKLREATQKEQNMFKEKDAPYYNRYIDIEMTVGQLEKEIADKKNQYEQLLSQKEKQEKDLATKEKEQSAPGQEVGDGEMNEPAPINEITEPLITKEQVNEAKKLWETAQNELKHYKNQQIIQVNSEIEQETALLTEIKAALEASSVDYSNVLDSREENLTASKDNVKSDLLVQVGNDLENVEQQIEQLEEERSLLEQQMKDNVVSAPIDGKVHILTNISKGDFLQAGTDILTIVPADDSSLYKVELAVLNQDIANTKVGDKVLLRLHSLPYQEYGKLEGEITQVSTDSIRDPQTGASYYTATATVKQHTVKNHKGEEASIKVGMTTDAHIVADSKKIIYYLLEKVNLLD